MKKNSRLRVQLFDTQPLRAEQLMQPLRASGSRLHCSHRFVHTSVRESSRGGSNEALRRAESRSEIIARRSVLVRKESGSSPSWGAARDALGSGKLGGGDSRSSCTSSTSPRTPEGGGGPLARRSVAGGPVLARGRSSLGSIEGGGGPLARRSMVRARSSLPGTSTDDSRLVSQDSSLLSTQI